MHLVDVRITFQIPPPPHAVHSRGLDALNAVVLPYPAAERTEYGQPEQTQMAPLVAEPRKCINNKDKVQMIISYLLLVPALCEDCEFHHV